MRRILKITIITVALLFSFIIAYGYYEASCLVVRIYHVESSCVNNTIVLMQLSDTHYPHKTPSLEKIIVVERRFKPNLTLLTGDYLANPSGYEKLKKLLEAIVSLEGSDRVYGVLGNWDFGLKKNIVYKAFMKTHANLLINNYSIIRIGDTIVTIVGLDDALHGHPNITVALAGYGLRILLAHEPELAMEAFNKGFKGVALTGHCHGGQVRILGHPLVTPKMCIPGVLDGLYRVRGGYLIVNAGLGNTYAPLRIGVKPEVVVLYIEPRKT